MSVIQCWTSLLWEFLYSLLRLSTSRVVLLRAHHVSFVWFFYQNSPASTYWSVLYVCFFFVSNYEFFEDPSSFSAMSAELPVFLSVVFFVVQLQKFSNYSM